MWVHGHCFVFPRYVTRASCDSLPIPRQCRNKILKAFCCSVAECSTQVAMQQHLTKALPLWPCGDTASSHGSAARRWDQPCSRAPSPGAVAVPLGCAGGAPWFRGEGCHGSGTTQEKGSSSSCPSWLCLDPVAAMRSLACCPPTARAEQEPPLQLEWEQRPWELSGISGALMAGEAQLALLLCVRAGTKGGRAQAALDSTFSVRATQDPLIVGTGNATCSGCLQGFAWAWQHNLSSTGAKSGFLTGSESPAESREFWAAFEALVHLFVEHPVGELDIPHTPDQRWFEGNRGGITAWLCVGQVRMSSSTSQPRNQPQPAAHRSFSPGNHNQGWPQCPAPLIPSTGPSV